MTRLLRPLRRLLLASGLSAALALAGCASGGTTPGPETGASGSGVTVYGTIDAGIGRTAR